jgi:hypothetical protein
MNADTTPAPAGAQEARSATLRGVGAVERTRAPDMDLEIGTVVLAFPGSRDGRAIYTKTRSKPWVLPSGDAVVMVNGYPGGIALTHIEVAPTTKEREDAYMTIRAMVGGDHDGE